MSHPLAIGGPVMHPAAAHEGPAALDPRRKLQLALAGIWLLDAMLQFQPAMFGHGFGRMLAASAAGNPAIVARPVSWSAAFIDHHVAVLNAIFAAIQVLLGLGIAWRPTTRPGPRPRTRRGRACGWGARRCRGRAGPGWRRKWRSARRRGGR